jgi:mRNA interferase MazF
LNPTFGTAAGKTRPVLMVQTNLLNKKHRFTLVCPITSNVKDNVNILRVNISKNASGLNQESAVMIDQMRAIDNRRFVKKLDDLPYDLIAKVKANLKIVLDL